MIRQSCDAMLLINMYKICTVVNINRMYCTVVKLLYFKIVSTNPSPLSLVPPPPLQRPHLLCRSTVWVGGGSGGGERRKDGGEREEEFISPALRLRSTRAPGASWRRRRWDRSNRRRAQRNGFMKQVCNVTEAIFVKLFNEWSPPTQARDVTVLFWLQA